MKKLILIALLALVSLGYVVASRAFGTVAKTQQNNAIAEVEMYK